VAEAAQRVSSYAEFLAGKIPAAQSVGRKAGKLHPSLYGFQEDITRWAVHKGCAAIFTSQQGSPDSRQAAEGAGYHVGGHATRRRRVQLQAA